MLRNYLLLDIIHVMGTYKSIVEYIIASTYSFKLILLFVFINHNDIIIRQTNKNTQYDNIL